MKKRLKNKSRQSVPLQEQSIHFRLCHVCLNLNEASQEVHKCEKCGHDFYSISEYLMSDEDEEEMTDDNSERELQAPSLGVDRGRSRNLKRLNGLIAVL